jgi:hypothetical protein
MKLRSNSSKPSRRRREPADRAEVLIDFLQAVVFGERQPTNQEVEDAAAELDRYLPDLDPEEVQVH